MNACVKISKLIVIIFNLIYILGAFFYIFYYLIDRANHSKFAQMDPTELLYVNTDTFVTYFKTEMKEDSRKCLTMMYETLTTLSTTGLGDFFPKADEERLLTVVLLLSGTSLFSFIMGSFLEIV